MTHPRYTPIYSPLPPLSLPITTINHHQLPPSTTINFHHHHQPPHPSTTNDHQQMDSEKLFPEKSLQDTAQYFTDESSWNFGHFATFCDRLLGFKVTRKVVEGLWCTHLKQICEIEEDKKRREKASSLLLVSISPPNLPERIGISRSSVRSYRLSAVSDRSLDDIFDPHERDDERIDLTCHPDGFLTHQKGDVRINPICPSPDGAY